MGCNNLHGQLEFARFGAGQFQSVIFRFIELLLASKIRRRALPNYRRRRIAFGLSQYKVLGLPDHPLKFLPFISVNHDIVAVIQFQVSSFNIYDGFRLPLTATYDPACAIHTVTPSTGRFNIKTSRANRGLAL